MPQQLSERPEELVRQFLTDNLRSAEIEGYDPRQTDPQETDYLPVTNDYSKWGTTYPMIWVGEQESPNVPGGGQTGYNGLGPNGPNIYNIKNVTVSCQTTESNDGAGYLNGVDYDDLAYTLYQEVQHQVQNNATTAISEAQWVGVAPPTFTREVSDDGSTVSFFQANGVIRVGVQDEP